MAPTATPIRDPVPIAPDDTRGRKWGLWMLFKRVVIAAIVIGVASLLVSQARSLDWPAVWTAVRALALPTLLGAAALAILSYLTYGSLDLFGWYYTGHPLPRRRMMTVAMVSYAFNMNLGTLVGGMGVRYRLYSRMGLRMAQLTQIVGLSVLTNWLAYPLLLGTALMYQFVPLPAEWGLPTEALRWVGAALWLLPLGYLAACRWSPRRSWTIKGHAVELPSGRVALLQLTLSLVNWLANASVIYLLLGQRVDVPAIVSALTFSAVAGLITHIPGGLGVLEGVFVALLSADMPKEAILGGLLAYRALYYLGPLMVAILVYLELEAATRLHPPHRSDPHPHQA